MGDEVDNHIGDLIMAYENGGEFAFLEALQKVVAAYPQLPKPPTKEPPSKIWECPMCKYRQVDVGAPDVVGR